ncbi:hypothetical protein [Marinifilum fragile]|uniref:hypothetical protein n=1 Tax=Marinifilum fragile TaxID=570161 RepID=UPI002AAB97BB|nr:hypothetical protein [Marinifilum fragile]
MIFKIYHLSFVKTEQCCVSTVCIIENIPLAISNAELLAIIAQLLIPFGEVNPVIDTVRVSICMLIPANVSLFPIICIERPDKYSLTPTNCIALINNERADINIEGADGR